ncbi:MAG TPA: carboxymuconolactone decarboxylase family protein [Nocardioidaceae bacterium]|nr:carboxymuconolactone decarboxylase family protein [Nocardioidaceae bacterium]
MTPTTSTLPDTTRARLAAVRVPVESPRGLFARAMAWYSRRTYGDVLDNGLVLLHHKRALLALAGFERKVDRWDELDPDLKTLATMASASVIGCSWCVDFGYYAAHSKGLRVDKLREVSRWRESDVFDSTERLVLEFAEALTVTPPEVTDELVERLNELLGVPAVVELALMVAVENERSRFNSALGLTSQGFSDRCELPG